MGTQLQEIIGEFGCTVLNYTKNKIIVDYFNSEKAYNAYLNGLNCRAGMGLHDTDEVLEFNKLNDNTISCYTGMMGLKLQDIGIYPCLKQQLYIKIRMLMVKR